MAKKINTRRNQELEVNEKRAKTIDSAKVLTKKLDILIAIMLAREGFQRGQVAEVLGVSSKTIERMFAGNWNKIGKADHETDK